MSAPPRPSRPPLSAVDRMIAARPDCVHRLKARDTTGAWAYHFVYVAPAKGARFERALAGPDTVDLEAYGQVIASCYGETPTEETLQYLRDKYGFDV